MIRQAMMIKVLAAAALAAPFMSEAVTSNRFSGQPIQSGWIKGQTPPAMYCGAAKYNAELTTTDRTQESLAELEPGDYTTTFSVPAAGGYGATSATASFTVYPETEKPVCEYEWIEFASANVHSAFDTGVRFNHRTTKIEYKYQKVDDRYGMYLTAADDDDALKYSYRLFLYDNDGFVVCQPNYNNIVLSDSETSKGDREVRIITTTGTDVTYDGKTMKYPKEMADVDTTDTLWIGTGDHFGGKNRSPFYGIGHRFYHLKMWSGGGTTLVHHWVPVRTTSGAAMLYDKVTGRLLPPFTVSGTTLALGGAATPMGGDVTPQVRQFEYLLTDGRGYLLTDYRLAPTTRVEMKFQLMADQPEGNQGLFWLDDAKDGSEWGCVQWDKGGGIGYYYNAGDGVTFVDSLSDTDGVHLIRVGGVTAQCDDNAPVSGAEALPALPNKNIMLFASRSWKSGHAVQYRARLRLYSFRIWEGDQEEPVRNYVAATNAAGVATLYDTVNGTFLDPPVGGTFAVGGEIEPEPVETYDWLQTDGNGFIETGYVPNLRKTRVEVVYEQISHDTGFFWMANACTRPGGSGSGNQMCCLNFGLHGAAGAELQYGLADGGGDHEVQYGTPERCVVSTNVTLGADAWLNGVRSSMPGYAPPDASASGPLMLFAGNWAGRYGDGAKAMLKAKVYRVTISEVDGSTTTVRFDYVPAKDGNGKATLYDRISGQFAVVRGDEADYIVGHGYPTKPAPPTPLDPASTDAPVAVSPENGATVDILTPMQRQFLAKSEEERRRDYVSQARRRDLGSLDNGSCCPQPLTLEWKGANAGNVGLCTVRVWRVRDGVETLHFEREVLGSSVPVDNFEVAADYRWEVSNALGSTGGAFTTRDETPRLLRDPDPAQNVTGIRDLGGRIGLNGRRLRQNRIFRSSRLNGPESMDENFITDANRSWWRDTLAIRTDLDLRSDGEVGVWRTTPIPNATWRHVSAAAYESFVRNPAAFKSCFDLFLDEANYPLVFHCVAGQDRTGCLAFVLETLLGVDADECLKDWEANAFRNADVEWNHEKYIDKFIASFDVESGDTLSERIVSWVRRQGYSEEQLNAFRELMLEPVPIERCDYLQTDGAGWLDLGFRPHLRNTRIEVVSTVDAGTDNANAFAWAHSDENAATYYRIGCAFWPDDDTFAYYVSTGGEKEKGYSSDLLVPSSRPGVHTVYFGGTDFVVDGVRTSVAAEPDDHVSGENMQLFVARPDNYQSCPSVKLYSVKVWNVEGSETNLVHHFVPVRIGESATLCDLLDPNRTPLAVRGEGANFTGGDDTTVVLPPAVTEFEYDGTEKRPLADAEGYTVLGDVTATVPGSYVMRVVPNGGRRWADDGTHDVRAVAWTIKGAWDPRQTEYGYSNKVTIASRDFCILTFTNTATDGFGWTVPAGVTSFDFLVVAGGGGGGAGMGGHASYCRKGGGGGAGGVVTGCVENASGRFTVKVGKGGAAGATLGANGEKGDDSSLSLGGENCVTAKGGGYGGGARWSANSAAGTGTPGGSGGSGGGGSSKHTSLCAGGAVEEPVIGGAVTVWESFGSAGGSGYSKSYAGGGGGAGGAGIGASSGRAADGEGGAGIVLSISGMTATYACGGGTACQGAQGDGATAGMATGNGGAGGYGSSKGVGYFGEAGGSGVVIIRYAVGSSSVVEQIQKRVDEAKSGESVLPAGVTSADVVLAADGASFAYGGRSYAKVHYVFRAEEDQLVAVIAPGEAKITSAAISATGEKFVVGTIENTVEGFSYSVEYADELGDDWVVGIPAVPGDGRTLTFEAPMSATGRQRFYRLIVTEGNLSGENVPCRAGLGEKVYNSSLSRGE